MKYSLCVVSGLLLCPIAFPAVPALELRVKEGGWELRWPAVLQREDGTRSRPYFELQRSVDLKNWEPVSDRLHAAEGKPGDQLSSAVAGKGGTWFYRLLSIEPARAPLADDGAGVFGYSAAFQAELDRIGEISPDQFADLFAQVPEYLPGITYDPTAAAYWAEFNAHPAVVNQGKTLEDPDYRTFDFRLNDPEMEKFREHGFVVSERLGAGSFADVYYNIWHNDLPVFISTDAILQAWHRTYSSMLQENEEAALYSGFEQILRGMREQIEAAAAETGGGSLRASLEDADYFLAVAQSLLAGEQVPSILGQDSKVTATLADVEAERLVSTELFGECRKTDFSQFKPRGHYTQTARLSRYFRCVTWLGRIDFAVAGGPFQRCGEEKQFASPRETAGAVVLWDLLKRSGGFEKWRALDKLIEAFVGWSDSMSFAQLGPLLAAAGIDSLADIPDLAGIQRLQAKILEGEIGVQNIRSDFFVSPNGLEQVRLPRSFTVFGQRFTPDSWAFSQTVYDSILWAGQKVNRRVPSALDTAFAVLGNSQVVPELVARMKVPNRAELPTHAERVRDGLPYQHHLAAVRNVIDAQEDSAWGSSVYLSWLGALRALSEPTVDEDFPEPMRTRAWAMKTLNTQLASWTHLRHDNILYVKQSYTSSGICAYPNGYVEPRVDFWMRLRETVNTAIRAIERNAIEGSYKYTGAALRFNGLMGNWEVVDQENYLPLIHIRQRQVAHLRRFAEVLARLEEMSRKQLRAECFTAEEELFIRNLIQDVGWSWVGCNRFRSYDGWYPRLFYRGVQFDRIYPSNSSREVLFQQNFGANARDFVVVDVHTNVPDASDSGSVLHQGVGKVNLLMAAIDNGHDRTIYAGPVLSHYEFETLGSPRRLDNFEWQTYLTDKKIPHGLTADQIEGVQPPPWTASYLVHR